MSSTQLPVGSALGMPLPMGAMGFPAASSNFAVSMPTSPVGGEIINRLNICRDFERGRCMRGENCFFAHPGEESNFTLFIGIDNVLYNIHYYMCSNCYATT